MEKLPPAVQDYWKTNFRSGSARPEREEKHAQTVNRDAPGLAMLRDAAAWGNVLRLFKPAPLPAIIFVCVRPSVRTVGSWKEIMPTDIIMPQMGESIVEGTITKWLKKPGDKVQRDEPLFEISTDKVDAEIPAPASGVLQEIKVSEGTTVGVNTVVGTIAADGEAAAPRRKPSRRQPAPPAKRRKRKKKKGRRAPPAPAADRQRRLRLSKPLKKAKKARSSPLVRKIAREHGVNLSQISGTGLGGRITKQDIMAFIERQASSLRADAVRPGPAAADGVASRSRRRPPRPPGSRCLSRRPRPHDQHAQDHRPAHDRVAPHQRSRPLHVRGGFHPHRQPAR